MKVKKIIHFDMDYFYAQVEQRDNPSLIGKPVGVGSDNPRRGVLCTCNYEARKFGVKGAMPTFIALKKCPQLILIKPAFKKYKEASETIFNIFKQYTNLVQGISLDEAYLDVSHITDRYASRVAKEIQEKVKRETGLTGSVGVSYNKLLAKIGSEMNKPYGYCVLPPDRISERIKNFPVEWISGVGKVTTEKMHRQGIKTFGDLQMKTKLDLINDFGNFGPKLFNYSRGIDHREVEPHRERKSLSVERTFSENYYEEKKLEPWLRECFNEMALRLDVFDSKLIKNIFIKIKYADFSQTTIERAMSEFTFENFLNLFQERFQVKPEAVRLIGTGVKFYSHRPKQLMLPCVAT